VRAFCLAGLAALTLQAQQAAQTFTLPNGLRVVHLEDHERPLVRVLLHQDLQPADTPAGHGGLAALALRLLDRSDAGDLKADDYVRLLDGAGILVDRTLRPGALEWRLLARSRDQDRALGLLADRVLRTVLDPQLLELQRLACWQEALRRQASPRGALREALTPDPGLRPTLQGLAAISLEDLLAFKARVFRPERAVLILHGDLGLEQAKRLVMLSLGSWTAPRFTAPDSAPLPPVADAMPLTVASREPGRSAQVLAQALIQPPAGLAPEVAALLGLLVPGDPALLPVQVSREDHGLVATLDAGPGDAATTVWSRLLTHLEALRRRGFTQADLDRAKEAWIARLSLESLDPERQMATALDQALGRGVSRDRLQAVPLEVLNTGLRRWLDPAGFRGGVTGVPEPRQSEQRPPKPQS
jgi:predicted Zn-dependent peptidase